MATLQEAVEALKRADKAGNVEDARRIARAIKNAQESQQEAPQAPEGGVVRGALETAGTLLSGSVAGPLAGLIGIKTGIVEAIRGDDDPVGAAAERIDEVSRALTFTPRTQTGQRFTEAVAVPFQALSESAQRVGGAVQDVTGSPLAAAATQSAIEVAPGAVGIRPRPRGVREDIARVTQEAKEVGVDLGGTAAEKTGQIQAAAQRELGGKTSRAESLEDVQTAVQAARDAKKAEVDLLYNEARSGVATVPVSQMQELPALARASLEGFDVDTMPIVQRRLKELDQLTELPKTAAVKLNAIAKVRERLSRNRPASTDTSQGAALNILKGQLDNFLEAKFNADMIKGDPTAITKWKNARAAHSQYMKTFKEDRTIRQLAEQNATPEEMRNWIFGASTTGAKKPASNTVKRLKEIIGEDSPEFRALRQDALLDVMEPLLRETPDFKRFVKNYDRLILQNKSLVKELFPESETALRKLKDFAKASENFTPAQQQVRLERFGAVAFFGHRLAKGALRIKLAERAFGLLRRGAEQSRKRQVVANILGYDALKPVIRPSAVGLPAAGQAVIQETELPEVVN